MSKIDDFLSKAFWWICSVGETGVLEVQAKNVGVNIILHFGQKYCFCGEKGGEC